MLLLLHLYLLLMMNLYGLVSPNQYRLLIFGSSSHIFIMVHYFFLSYCFLNTPIVGTILGGRNIPYIPYFKILQASWSNGSLPNPFFLLKVIQLLQGKKFNFSYTIWSINGRPMASVSLTWNSMENNFCSLFLVQFLVKIVSATNDQ